MKVFSFTRVSLFLLFAASNCTQAQTMQELFLSLPSYCTPGLSNSERKTLLKDTDYTVPAHKEEDEIDYTIDTIAATYLSYEFSNSKGQGTNENYEIKKFKTTGGKSFLLFSKTGDPRVHSNKYIIKSYDINGTSLTENFSGYIPEDLDYSIFLTFGTPDSVKAYLNKTAYYTFDLDQNSTDKVNFNLILESDKIKKWLLGNTMVFLWSGKMFTSSIIFKKEDE